MGKIGPESSKYIISASINIEGIVDKPDVIGAIFGQTEGLLGADLELRELQRSGRIGRIEVNTQNKGGKTFGTIIIPSALDKAETAIVAAALEIIQRIGPCTSKIKVDSIEDIRVAKRNLIVSRAKVLLKDMIEKVLPASQELSDKVSYSVRTSEICEYGKKRLPSGPNIKNSEEIILVEGRADVINLLKYGFKNAIAINGTSVPEEIAELSKHKNVIVFVDGDRGGDLIIKELLSVAEIDFITKAPDGKEVEEITSKEIHKALRSKMSVAQYKLEKNNSTKTSYTKNKKEPLKKIEKPAFSSSRPKKLPKKEKEKFSEMLDDLLGTRGAYILDENMNILGKVPSSELKSTLKSLDSGVYAIILEGKVDSDLLKTAENSKIKYIVAKESTVKSSRRVEIITANEL